MPTKTSLKAGGFRQMNGEKCLGVAGGLRFARCGGMSSTPIRRDAVTQLLEQLSAGKPQAIEELLPLIYTELRRQAARCLRRERRGHTLQPTALVHEAYMKLMEQRDVQWQNRSHFLGIAAQAMRRILIDHARTRGRNKRGGALAKVELEEGHAIQEAVSIDVLALDQALTRLQAVDVRQARIVELRYFGGLSVDETAEVMEISPATVKRDWTMAKAWLFDQLSRQP
jgi:RNA polymerase sigma factor (TIGR02999 family)